MGTLLPIRLPLPNGPPPFTRFCVPSKLTRTRAGPKGQTPVVTQRPSTGIYPLDPSLVPIRKGPKGAVPNISLLVPRN